MLYVGCSNCRSIVPLLCAGNFPPHAPLPVMSGPYGAYCSFCGPLLPFFTCTICWARQMLYIPGSPFVPPTSYLGSNPNIAPVVHAQPGASHNQLFDLIRDVLPDLVGTLASQTGNEVASMFYLQWEEQPW